MDIRMPGIDGLEATRRIAVRDTLHDTRVIVLTTFVRRMPFALGWLTKRGDAVTKRWMQPILTQPGIRTDTVRILRSIARNRNLLVDLGDGLRSFDRPTLVVWASEDKVMPPEHGRRLHALLPHSRLVEVADSYALIPLDQPIKLAEALRQFATVATG